MEVVTGKPEIKIEGNNSIATCKVTVTHIKTEESIINDWYENIKKGVQKLTIGEMTVSYVWSKEEPEILKITNLNKSSFIVTMGMPLPNHPLFSKAYGVFANAVNIAVGALVNTLEEPIKKKELLKVLEELDNMRAWMQGKGFDVNKKY